MWTLRRILEVDYGGNGEADAAGLSGAPEHRDEVQHLLLFLIVQAVSVAAFFVSSR